MSSTLFEGIPSFGYREMLLFLRIARAANVPVLMWGPPGIGKSSLVKYTCNDIDGKFVTEPVERQAAIDEGRMEPLETLIGSIADPTDILGFPVPIEGENGSEIVFLPRQWAKSLLAAKRGVLFLDELTSCPPSVQNALLKLVLDRVAGDIHLPEEVFIVAAANPPTQMTMGHDLTPPMSNRFAHVILNPIKSDSDDFVGNGTKIWIEGMTSGWHSVYRDVPIPKPLPQGEFLNLQGSVFGYLHKNPEAVRFSANVKSGGGDGNDAMAGDYPLAFPTHRSWDAVVRMLSWVNFSTDGDERINTSMKHAILRSLIGQSEAASLMAHLSDIKLPDPGHVLLASRNGDEKTLDSLVDWKQASNIWAMSLSVFALYESDIPKYHEAANAFLKVLADRNYQEIGLSQITRVVSHRTHEALKEAGITWKFDPAHRVYSQRNAELKKGLV